MALVVLTKPANPAVTLADAKQHLRMDTTADDALINALIYAAGDFVERKIRKPLIYTTYRYTIDAFPFGPLELPRQPVPRITADGTYEYDMPRVRYYDTGGVFQVLEPGDRHEFDLGYNPPRLQLLPMKYWPITQPGKRNAVEVDFVSGFGPTAASVPELLKAAMLMLIGHWYENRQAVQPDAGGEVPLAVDSILRIYCAGDYQFHQLGGYQ